MKKNPASQSGLFNPGILLHCVLCLALLSVPAIASGQTGRHKSLPTEELERYDDPPALVWRIGRSPGMVSPHGAYTSYQVNVDSSGQNITGDAANEPSICLDPTNASKMAIGWRQFDSVASNFRQAGWGYTSNGGMSWTFPGALESNVFRSDPVLASDDTGRFFYLSLRGTGTMTDMWRSLNGGQAWTLPGSASGGDKAWFTIDNTNSIGHGFQYQCWGANGGYFSRSTDGGFTWTNPPLNIYNALKWGTPDVDTNGNLFIGGVNANTGKFWCNRSSNGKMAAATPTFDQSTAVDLGGDPRSGTLINPGGLVGQIFLAVDRSGTSTNNNIYMLASVQPTGFTSGTDVMFARSTDGGQTFSFPRRINDDLINHDKWHWFGTLSVAPNGRIDAVWLDTRNAANNTDSQLFYSYSTDGGNTWSRNIAVSNSFDPFLGYPNQNKMGDYITVVSDNSGGNVAYCATFNSEEDIYYVHVTPEPLRAVSRKAHGGAGTFDVQLPLSGSVGIECRSGGPDGDYTMVFIFANTVTFVGNASVTSGTGTVSGSGINSNDAHQYIVNLTGVTTAQVITVSLTGVIDSGGNISTAVSASMGVLVGDTTGNRTVNASDVSQTKSKSGQTVNASNFRTDVTVSNSINSSDVSLVKSKSGTALP